MRPDTVWSAGHYSRCSQGHFIRVSVFLSGLMENSSGPVNDYACVAAAGSHPSRGAEEHISGLVRDRQRATIGGLELGEMLGRGSFGKVYKGEPFSLRPPPPPKRSSISLCCLLCDEHLHAEHLHADARLGTLEALLTTATREGSLHAEHSKWL